MTNWYPTSYIQDCVVWSNKSFNLVKYLPTFWKQGITHKHPDIGISQNIRKAKPTFVHSNHQLELNRSVPFSDSTLNHHSLTWLTLHFYIICLNCKFDWKTPANPGCLDHIAVDDSVFHLLNFAGEYCGRRSTLFYKSLITNYMIDSYYLYVFWWGNWCLQIRIAQNYTTKSMA